MNWDRLPIVRLGKGVGEVLRHIFIDVPLWFIGYTYCQNCGRKISPREDRHVESACGFDGTYEWYTCTDCGRN